MELSVAVDEIGKLEFEYESIDRQKMRAYLLKRGLPIEVVTRLDDLWTATKEIWGKVLKVGKIIFLKIAEFIAKYPHVAIGILVGAAIGFLVNGIPLLGPLLSPITTALGALAGGIAGAKIDTGKDGLQSLIIVVKDFFSLIIEIFQAIFAV